MSQILFFDLETAANPEALALMPLPKPAANLKDPEKIRASIEEKRAEQVATAALDPDLGRIIVLGYAVGGDKPLAVTGDEAAIITHFWSLFEQCDGCCCGYNIISFDLPYLMRRSMALNINIPYVPNLAKYRTFPTIDLMGILYNWGPAKGLKTVAQIYGIPNAAAGITGADVASMPIEEVSRYCESDVQLVIDLYKRMNGIYFKKSPNLWSA